MPHYYYSVRDTDSYRDVKLHADRDCIDGPARAAPGVRRPEFCPKCTDEGEDDVEEPTEDEDGEADTPMQDRDTEQLVGMGICPWCDEYEGDHVGQHASSAHPDEWRAYKN